MALSPQERGDHADRLSGQSSSSILPCQVLPRADLATSCASDATPVPDSLPSRVDPHCPPSGLTEIKPLFLPWVILGAPFVIPVLTRMWHGQTIRWPLSPCDDCLDAGPAANCAAPMDPHVRPLNAPLYVGAGDGIEPALSAWE